MAKPNIFSLFRSPETQSHPDDLELTDIKLLKKQSKKLKRAKSFPTLQLAKLEKHIQGQGRTANRAEQKLINLYKKQIADLERRIGELAGHTYHSSHRFC